MRILYLCLFFLVMLGIEPSPAFAHGALPPPPAPGQPEAVAAPVPGADEFFKELAGHARPLLTQEQTDRLQEVRGLYVFADQARASGEGGNPSAEHYRRRAEQALLKLASNLPDKRLLDFRPGATPAQPPPVLALPGPVSSLLFEVTTGDGAPQFRVQHVNLTSSGDCRPFLVAVAPGCKTYLLLDLEEIPSGESRLLLAFREDGAQEPSRWDAITVRTEPLGQLGIEILDEHGKPTPAFVRLTSEVNGKLWEPPNAIDLSPIMTSVTGLPIYGPGRGYTHHMPGTFRGSYWIVPGPFEMALPPGEWEVHIHHGAEYTPIHKTLAVESGKWTRGSHRLKRWTNMPERGWWSADDHVHAKLTTSEDADRIMAFVRAANINVANILEMGNEDRTWYAQRGFGKAFRVRSGDHVLVPGQEDPRSAFGHTIGLNLTSLVRDLDHYYLTDWVADGIHRQGGLYGHTHVGEGGLGVHRDMTLLMPQGKSDFGSIMQNVLGTERYYDFLDLGFELTASAGTDTPYGGAVGVVRCYAYLGTGTPFGPDAWFGAFSKGRTFVTNGPMVDFRVDEAYPGDRLVLDKDRPLRVSASAWGLAGASAPAKLEVVRCGEVIAEATSDDPQREGLKVETVPDSKFGFWIAARVTGHDGSQAHTTPVYVTRRGFRHWNVARADELLRDRLATLDEIDTMVAEAERKRREGQLAPLDRWNGLQAEQAPQIRERTALARSLYEDLRKSLASELKARMP